MNINEDELTNKDYEFIISLKEIGVNNLTEVHTYTSTIKKNGYMSNEKIKKIRDLTQNLIKYNPNDSDKLITITAIYRVKTFMFPEEDLKYISSVIIEKMNGRVLYFYCFNNLIFIEK